MRFVFAWAGAGDEFALGDAAQDGVAGGFGGYDGKQSGLRDSTIEIWGVMRLMAHNVPGTTAKTNRP